MTSIKRGSRRSHARLRIAALLAGASLSAVAAHAQDATWTPPVGPSANWNNPANWTPTTVPTSTAFFGASNATTVTFSLGTTSINTIQFNNAAPSYIFNITPGTALSFSPGGIGAGIVNNSPFSPTFNNGGNLSFSGSSAAANATINNNFGFVFFNDNSNAGSANISNAGSITFGNSSSAANASIVTQAGGFLLSFADSSTASNATITTNNGSLTQFFDNSTGGNARFITNAGGLVDFSGSTGPLGNKQLSAWSIEGAGNYFLGSNTLTVGSNNLSTTVSGVISDCGTGTQCNNSGATGGSLVKVGTGTLILSGNNTYTGGTTINGGTLQLGNGSTTGSISGNVTDNGTFAINRSDTLTFNGVISGSGGFAQNGTGTTILTANNTYTGPTAVNAGTLQAGAANAFAPTSAFTVAPGATFNLASFNQSIGSLAGAGSVALGSASLTTGNDNTSTIFAGTISGAGNLFKLGGGTFVLSGTNSYTGNTVVNGGTLEVDGSIASSSSVSVNAGATLSGTGVVDPPGITSINNGATLAPGNASNPMGTLTITGNLAFQSGAIYLIQVTPGAASSTSVAGTATLGGTVQALFVPGSYGMVHQYTILHSAGLSGTTFSALAPTNLPLNFNASLSYTATDVLLNLRADLAGGLFGLSENQRSVANALNNFFNNGGALPPNFLALFGLTGGNLANALTLLSGEVATGSQQVAFKVMDQFLTLMLDPFVGGRAGAGGFGTAAVAFAPDREAMPADLALAYAKLLRTPVYKAPTFDQRWSAWAAGYGGYSQTSGDPVVVGSHDLTARTAGAAAGLDYRIAPGTVIGFALGGGGTGWQLAQGLGSGGSDVFQAGVYAKTHSGPFYLAGALAYTQHWMSTDRFAFAGDRLYASFNAESIGGRAEAGYRVVGALAAVTPYAAIQAQNFHTPAYSETDYSGGVFGLTYNARNASDTRSELGARFDKQMLLNWNAVLALRSKLAWAHDWISDPTLVPAFQALPGASFIVQGATPAKNAALTSAGAELRLVNGVSLVGKFDGEFAAHSQTYAGTGTLRYVW